MSVEQPPTKRSKKADDKANASGSAVSAAVDVNYHKHLNASLTLLRTHDDLIALAPKPSLECYREESKPDLSNKRVVRTIGKTEKKCTVVCFFALRVSFSGNWGGTPGGLATTYFLFTTRSFVGDFVSFVESGFPPF